MLAQNPKKITYVNMIYCLLNGSLIFESWIGQDYIFYDMPLPNRKNEAKETICI